MNENKKHEITKLIDDLVYHGTKLEYAETRLEHYKTAKLNTVDLETVSQLDSLIESRRQRVADVKLQIETRKSELLHLIEEVSV